MQRQAIGIALSMGLMVTAAAQAAEPVEVRYEVFWGGFRAAEARLSYIGGDSQLAIQATGLVNSVSAFVLNAEAQPDFFRSNARSTTMESLLAVDFSGLPRTIVDEIRRTDPDEDKDAEPRPPVPDAMKLGAHDPLTALVTASRQALAAKPGEHFAIAVYDGRNRYDIMIAIVGPASSQISGRTVTGTKAKIQFKPIAGFRPQSQKTWDGAAFTVLLDPATQLPARIVSDSFTIATVVSAVPLAKKSGG